MEQSSHPLSMEPAAAGQHGNLAAPKVLFWSLLATGIFTGVSLALWLTFGTEVVLAFANGVIMACF